MYIYILKEEEVINMISFSDRAYHERIGVMNHELEGIPGNFPEEDLRIIFQEVRDTGIPAIYHIHCELNPDVLHPHVVITPDMDVRSFEDLLDELGVRIPNRYL